MEIRPEGADSLSEDRRTDRHVSKLRVAFCNFANLTNYEAKS